MMGFALPCLNLILVTLALAELTIPEKELSNLHLDRLQEEAELVDLLTLPEECQRLVGFYWQHVSCIIVLAHFAGGTLSLLPESSAQSILIRFV